MDDQEDDFTPWTAEGAALLLQADDALVEAIRTHTAAVTGLRGEDQSAEVFASGDQLRHAVLAYADAQFEYTGIGFPLGIIHQFDDDEEDDDVDHGPVAGVSVLRRTDYVVSNEAAVIKAGRKAYRRVRPEDDAAAAAADVTHLGRALYQLAHADGWDNLDDVKGLDRVGEVVIVQSSDALLGADPDAWPDDDLFGHDDARLLYRQDDAYGD